MDVAISVNGPRKRHGRQEALGGVARRRARFGSDDGELADGRKDD